MQNKNGYLEHNTRFGKVASHQTHHLYAKSHRQLKTCTMLLSWNI